MKFKTALQSLVFGRISFETQEEFLEFQYYFLFAIMLCGSLLTGLFILGAHTGVNRIADAHVEANTAFCLLGLVLAAVLRGRKNRVLPVAWTYEVASLLINTSGLLLMPDDEVRVLWLYTNLAGVYTLLGRRAGLVITLVSLVQLLVCNHFTSKPLSPNGLATVLVSLPYMGLFFHVYTGRLLSYFARLQNSNAQLQELATHDTLTGVFNARAYYQLCDQSIHLATRRDSAFSVLFVDLDHFKKINDTHGHAAGDLVLKAVANTLQTGIRKSDILGRIGGEEFSIFLPDTMEAGALLLAESLREQIEALMPQLPSGPIRITASIGVASSSVGQAMHEIQQQADQAMYHAKAQGRNRVSSLATVLQGGAQQG